MTFSVLADGAREHYRGGYHHRPVDASPTVAALSLAADLGEPQRGRGSVPVRAAHAAAVLTGLAGLGFHLRNVTRQPGGVGLKYRRATPAVTVTAQTACGLVIGLGYGSALVGGAG